MFHVQNFKYIDKRCLFDKDVGIIDIIIDARTRVREVQCSSVLEMLYYGRFLPIHLLNDGIGCGR